MTRITSSALIGLTAILLGALSLRIPTTSLGPLLPEIRSSTGYGETLLSSLTSIPLAMTLLVAPISPWLASRLGRDRVLGFALVGITAGTLLRSAPGSIPLFTGTLILGFSIATATVLLPAAISAESAELRARFTGVYSMALSLGPTLALGLTVPIMQVSGLDWRGTLMVWAGCGIIALLFWALYIRTSRPAAAVDEPPVARFSPALPVGVRAVVADPKVWLLALYLGITSVTFYTTSAWLPTTLMMDGLSPAAAGSYTAMINIVAIPFAFLAPLMIRHGYARALAPLAPAGAVIGVVVLVFTGAAGALPSVLLLGLAQGLCLGISYDQVVRYAASPAHAASVSAVTQAVGVALAAVGPLAYGFGLEVTPSATLSLCGLGLVVLLQILVGFRTGKAVAARQ